MKPWPSDAFRVFQRRDSNRANPFVGAPVLARELETGTYRYAWTQGFGRWRWTVAKLVGLAVAVAVAAGALGLILSWYYEPYFAAANQSRFLNESSPLSSGLFDLRGIAFGAWTLVVVC